jgi:hypothetical protein
VEDGDTATSQYPVEVSCTQIAIKDERNLPVT